MARESKVRFERVQIHKCVNCDQFCEKPDGPLYYECSKNHGYGFSFDRLGRAHCSECGQVVKKATDQSCPECNEESGGEEGSPVVPVVAVKCPCCGEWFEDVTDDYDPDYWAEHFFDVAFDKLLVAVRVNSMKQIYKCVACEELTDLPAGAIYNQCESGHDAEPILLGERGGPAICGECKKPVTKAADLSCPHCNKELAEAH